MGTRVQVQVQSDEGQPGWRQGIRETVLLIDANRLDEAAACLADLEARHPRNRSVIFLQDVVEFRRVKADPVGSCLCPGGAREDRASNATISVVVPYFNHLPYLGTLLDSLTQQTYRDFEVLVVDDFSSPDHDPTQLIESFNHKMNIHYHRLEEKGFTAGARQRGAELAHGSILTFIDADDVAHCQRLECINHVFATTAVVHLTHGYQMLSGDPEQLSRRLFSSVAEIDQVLVGCAPIRERMLLNVAEGRWADSPSRPGCYDAPGVWGTHAGHVSYLSSVTSETPWRNGRSSLFSPWEDYEMSMQLLFRYDRSMHLDLPLSGYRLGSSTHMDHKPSTRMRASATLLVVRQRIPARVKAVYRFGRHALRRNRPKP